MIMTNPVHVNALSLNGHRRVVLNARQPAARSGDNMGGKGLTSVSAGCRTDSPSLTSREHDVTMGMDPPATNGTHSIDTEGLTACRHAHIIGFTN
ncbi:hypothetical protein [Aidingimonas lacisalsi]|uniref:hypothetical protein n=1 Tax=Aidingimonas lacisalsi TaxID=2604086 RepID=UPI0011D26057|nr:hypothetical protein [Aidingimonas lacisalsi]